jgi:tetratricopeptide (TPR) repeat protein
MGTAVTALVLAIVPALTAQETNCNQALSASLEAEARSAMSARDYQLAARRFEEAFRACPEKRESVAGRVVLANAYLMAQRFKDARGEAEAVLREHPDEPAALKIKANAAYLSGDFATAKDTFIGLLDRYPTDGDGAYMLGRIYYQEGYIDLAMGQFERVLRLDSGSYKALDNLGLCYQANGEDEAATRYFLAAIKLVEKDHAGYEWPYVNLADLLLRRDDAQRAFDAASKAANLNPLSARGFYIGAKALNQLGKTELALNWLQRAIALNASSSESWYLLARIYRNLQQNDKAEQALHKFRELKAMEPAHRR